MILQAPIEQKVDKPLVIKVKKLIETASIPKAMTYGAAGFDLTATSKTWDPLSKTWTFGTGLAFEIPEGHFGALVPRSSVYRTGLSLCNSFGVCDSDFRGEVSFKFYSAEHSNMIYNVGDRIGQLLILPVPRVEVLEALELIDSERGASGWGSTGK